MKIKFKLSIDQLIALNKLLLKLYEFDLTLLKQQQKVVFSIGLRLSDKFDKKRKDIQKKSSLFDTKKKISFTLDYYEAWSLKGICVELITLSETDYQKLSIQQIINKLDPLLL